MTGYTRLKECTIPSGLRAIHHYFATLEFKSRRSAVLTAPVCDCGDLLRPAYLCVVGYQATKLCCTPVPLMWAVHGIVWESSCRAFHNRVRVGLLTYINTSTILVFSLYSGGTVLVIVFLSRWRMSDFILLRCMS